MYRLKPIRRRKAPRPPRALMQGADAAFCALALAAIVIGGGHALEGLPALAAIIVPAGVVPAEASSAPHEPFAALRLASDIVPSPYAPQVLYPIATHPYPGWLTARADPAAVPAAIDTTPPLPGPPKVAIVIDDLGADLARTDRAIALPKPVALSFLPYADATGFLASEAARGGHDVLLHMPMEAQGDHDPGPLALTTGLAPDEIRRRLDAALARVPQAVGINNHMGSRATTDRATLIPIAEDLARHRLFFFDSRTTPDTQIVPVARAFGVASAGRDVFLDDEETADAVDAQFQALEARARAQGIAIAIGHPHDVTLSAIAAWTARAGARGFVLVPLAEAMQLKTERDVRQASAATR
jgi:polysaccharide deacetylase 2 family uncharacterized protein YibQ